VAKIRAAIAQVSSQAAVAKIRAAIAQVSSHAAVAKIDNTLEKPAAQLNCMNIRFKMCSDAAYLSLFNSSVVTCAALGVKSYHCDIKTSCLIPGLDVDRYLSQDSLFSIKIFADSVFFLVDINHLRCQHIR
jgi:hypothetical protein